MNEMFSGPKKKLFRPNAIKAHEFLEWPLEELKSEAVKIRDSGFDRIITYSRKVFIPLTQLCRNVCHYCTFAQTPKSLNSLYLTRSKVLEIAKTGQATGCKEALFTLGDKPELRYKEAKKFLTENGYQSTIEYLQDMAEIVFQETGLLPHVNPGILNKKEITSLRKSSVSMGLMLENSSIRLSRPGFCHHGSPDKLPRVRIKTISEAGKQNVPFTSGILIGIGESRTERINSLIELRNLHEKFGHLQEIIIQNFRAKDNTLMANAPEPDLNELLWTIAVARILFGKEMSIQSPPNLSANDYSELIRAGINDWGGISPITPDYVNPEAPWPHIADLSKKTREAGKILLERMPVYPMYIVEKNKWIDKHFHAPILQSTDADGLPKIDNWFPGSVHQTIPPLNISDGYKYNPNFSRLVYKAYVGNELNESEVVRLLQARDGEVPELVQAADQLRREINGPAVSYIVTRNINYTNICGFKCKFCAFSKGKMNDNLRGRPYNLDLGEIVKRTREAWERGAVEVCLQGGIHPDYTGQTYINIVKAIKANVPQMHVHAFSPLEIFQGAKTLDLSLTTYIQALIDAGLNSLPGTAAEILDDEVRSILCPDKLSTSQWFEVIDTAHRLGLKSTATIMFGHIERPIHVARHLILLRKQQQLTGGFTELVPLPFVHMEAPIYLKGQSRKGPSWREVILTHAVSRLVLNSWIPNIQASWVKLGAEGVAACLESGANDMGGTLMNESITRAAGAKNGQEMTPQNMNDLAQKLERPAKQRTTLYGRVSKERQIVSFS